MNGADKELASLPKAETHTDWLNEFHRVNNERQHEAFAPAHSLLGLLVCVMEEVGEMAGSTLGITGEKKRKAHLTKDDLLDGVADAITYLSLVASHVGCTDLQGLLGRVFNMVSDRAGSKLTVPLVPKAKHGDTEQEKKNLMDKDTVHSEQSEDSATLHTPTRILGFASWKDGSFELIIRDEDLWEETTLKGKLEEGQFEKIDKILPTCVFVQARCEPEPASSANDSPKASDSAAKPESASVSAGATDWATEELFKLEGLARKTALEMIGKTGSEKEAIVLQALQSIIRAASPKTPEEKNL